MKRHFFGPDVATALLLQAFEMGAEKVLHTLIVVPRHAHNQTSNHFTKFEPHATQKKNFKKK